MPTQGVSRRASRCAVDPLRRFRQIASKPAEQLLVTMPDKATVGPQPPAAVPPSAERRFVAQARSVIQCTVETILRSEP